MKVVHSPISSSSSHSGTHSHLKRVGYPVSADRSMMMLFAMQKCVKFVREEQIEYANKLSFVSRFFSLMVQSKPTHRKTILPRMGLFSVPSSKGQTHSDCQAILSPKTGSSTANTLMGTKDISLYRFDMEILLFSFLSIKESHLQMVTRFPVQSFSYRN